MLRAVTLMKPFGTSQTETLKRYLLWSVLAVAGYLCIFEVPFFFPPSTPTLSAAYSAGFNNKLASIAAVLFAIASFAMARNSAVKTTKLCLAEGQRPPKKLLWIALLAYASILSVYSASLYAYDHGYGEASYFLNRLNQIVVFGKVPFRDFEFAYGPLLLYVPAFVHWLGAPLHISVERSYYVSLIVLSLVGVYALFWLVNEIVPGYHDKVVVFAAFALFGLNPTMGMNYMYFRFVGPYIGLLISERFTSLRPTLTFVCMASFLLFSISPEMGLAYSVGTSALGVCRALDLGASWLGTILAAWLGPAFLLGIFGWSYIQTFLVFAKGAQNFVVLPFPHIFLFLVALIFIIPLGAARVPWGEWRKHPGLTGMLLSCIALVPAALGRCDAGHVFWNGLGMILLSLNLGFRHKSRARSIWLGIVCIVFFFCFLAGLRTYVREVVPVLAAGVRAYAPWASALITDATPIRLRTGLAELKPVSIDTTKLVRRVGKSEVAMPFGVDKDLAHVLQQVHVYSPSFFRGTN